MVSERTLDQAIKTIDRWLMIDDLDDPDIENEEENRQIMSALLWLLTDLKRQLRDEPPEERDEVLDQFLDENPFYVRP